jgi:type IV secretory pathway TrbL component
MVRERVLIGVVVACALGVGLMAGAVGARAAGAYNTEGWIGGNDLLSRSEGFQSGYVAGMADAMSHVAHNISQDVDWVQKAKCLDRNSGLSAGGTGHLSALVDWARDMLRQRPDDASRYHAATILIINACR